jgi:molybdenum cofactor cytidylyltransferase
MSRLFAIIPAAGHSRRMGRPKLLLNWGGATVIDHVVRVLRRPEIAATMVVVRPGDEPLRAAVEHSGARVLTPAEPPPEMRDSVEFALKVIDQEFCPLPADGWILAPADHPLLAPEVLDDLIARWLQSDCLILAPAHQGKRGHPVFFRWSLAAEVLELPKDRGLNALVQRHAQQVVDLPIADPGVLLDLDTPADYERLTDSKGL